MDKGKNKRTILGFGDWIRHLRKGKGWTQAEFADLSKGAFSRALIGIIEIRDIVPSREKMIAMMDVLELNADLRDLTWYHGGYLPEDIGVILAKRPEGLGRILNCIARSGAAYARAVELTMPKDVQKQEITDARNRLTEWLPTESDDESKELRRCRKSIHNMNVTLTNDDVDNALEYWRQAEHWKMQYEKLSTNSTAPAPLTGAPA